MVRNRLFEGRGACLALLVTLAMMVLLLQGCGCSGPADNEAPKIQIGESQTDDATAGTIEVTGGTETPGDGTEPQEPEDSEDVNPVEAHQDATTAQAEQQLGDSSMLNTSVADDGNCAIRVVSVGDYYGDPGFVLEITNRTDAPLRLEAEGFQVQGTAAQAMLDVIVDPGQTQQDVLWFSDLAYEGDAAKALVDVAGAIRTTNYQTGELIGTYDFAA